MRFRLAALLICSLVCSSIQPVQATDSQFELWGAVFLGKDLGEAGSGLNLWFDGHARRGRDGTVSIIRPAIGYRFFPELTAHLGYAWVPTFNDGSAGDVHEHRIWQQLIWSPRPLKPLLINVRPRFEQRFVSGAGGEVGLRMRLFLRANWSFAQSPFLVAVWDEIFFPLNDTDWGQTAGFGQNRIFVGPGVAGFPGMRIEVGYLNVFLNRDTDQLNHNLAVNLFMAF